MPKITFVLPVRGGSGGAHSVVQEVTALRELGVEARVMVNRANAESFATAYDRFDWVQEGGLAVFDGPRDLAGLVSDSNVVIATTNTSVHSMAEAIAATRGANFRTGYYVQDYEPLFYAAGTAEHALAVASFSVLRNCTYFAKTSWLTGVVHAAHGHHAQLVVPSIDHGIYRPRRRPANDRRVVAAMVRPSTPRRAPKRTLAMLARLAAGEFGDVEAVAFGTDAAELAEAGFTLPDGVRLVGQLKQVEVAELLRGSDLFLDLSDYQAFGRTAAEAMACGCIAVAPALGGTNDFLVEATNGFLVDTCDEDAIAGAIRRVLSLSEAELSAVKLAGLETVSTFTPVRAAVSELRALGF